VVHHGVSLEDAITISVGYRAPAIAELAAAYCADTVSTIDTELFYSDTDIEPREEPGLITKKELGKVRETLRAALSRSDEELDRWFASFTTDVKPGHYLPEPVSELSTDELLTHLNQVGELWRSEYARFAYIEQQGSTILYVAGEEIPLAEDLAFAAPLLCGQRLFGLDELQLHLEVPDFADLLTALYNLGALYFPE
jgi:50S ribosomal protein L16 3-hydroxylase